MNSHTNLAIVLVISNVVYYLILQVFYKPILLVVRKGVPSHLYIGLLLVDIL